MRMALVLPVLAAGVLLAGCGSDDGGDGMPLTKPFGAKTVTTSTTPAKPTKTAPELSPADGESVTVGKGEYNPDVVFAQTVHCRDNDVSVESDNGQLTFTGQCRSIALYGSLNMLTVERAGSLKFMDLANTDIVQAKAVDTITLGPQTMGNIITADSDLAGTGKPRCDDSGMQNDC